MVLELPPTETVILFHSMFFSSLVLVSILFCFPFHSILPCGWGTFCPFQTSSLPSLQTSQPRSEQDHRITESQTAGGWKGPLGLILPVCLLQLHVTF